MTSFEERARAEADFQWEDTLDNAERKSAFVAGALWAREQEPTEAIYQLLADLVDPDDCWFDHHGGCQAHGYLSLKPGEMCPNEEAKALLAAKEEME